ncbi:MAG: SAM-dependent methyltransferase [Paludibacteraceae bacterium]|nr:SAM-dependent methyltransferase [Paludibacteraceae bacterium]
MRQYPDVDAAFALQQIAGWQKAREKLPELAGINVNDNDNANVNKSDGFTEWLWPRRLSLEQCSSEVTAKYKRGVMEGDGFRFQVSGFRRLVDLTGGLGVDCYYLSPGFREVHYVERDEELCRLAAHNFALTGRNIAVHNTTAEEWLERQTPQSAEPTAPLFMGAGARDETTIFLDPARRDGHGGKVFRLEDCEPNVVTLLNILRAHAYRVLLKLSPMLDITAALRSLGGAAEVHVVAVRNEVKELLVLLEDGRDSMDPMIRCVNLGTAEPEFVFRRSEEEKAIAQPMAVEGLLVGERDFVLVEPNAAILKAGAFRVFGERYGVSKLGANTQLYACPFGACPELVQKRGPLTAVPGRVFLVHQASKEELKGLTQANVICRNYPLSAEALKKQLKVKDGGETYVIGTRIGAKPAIFVGLRQ